MPFPLRPSLQAFPSGFRLHRKAVAGADGTSMRGAPPLPRNPAAFHAVRTFFHSLFCDVHGNFSRPGALIDMQRVRRCGRKAA